jgi:hypothetical protein
VNRNNNMNNNTFKRLYHKKHDNTESDDEVETRGSPTNSTRWWEPPQEREIRGGPQEPKQ